MDNVFFATGSSQDDVPQNYKFILGMLHRRSRSLAEKDFLQRDKNVAMIHKQDRKKRMRIKSAYISRNRQRYYEKLLVEHFSKCEDERDIALQRCIDYSQEIKALRQQLHGKAKRLTVIADTITEKLVSLVDMNDQLHIMPSTSEQQPSILPPNLRSKETRKLRTPVDPFNTMLFFDGGSSGTNELSLSCSVRK